MVIFYNGFCITSHDKILFLLNGELLEGDIINSGEGVFSQYESPEYLLLAPLFLDNPFDSESEQEFESNYLIIKVHANHLPFSQIPIDVDVEILTAKSEKEDIKPMNTKITITSVVGSKKPDEYYLCANIPKLLS